MTIGIFRGLHFCRFMLLAGLALVGCSPTHALVNQWSNPAYAAPSFKKVMVAGVAGQTSLRRSFEDEFAAQLRAAGVDAVPSYLHLPDDVNFDVAKLRAAAGPAGADALILARSVGVEQKTEYAPSYYPAPYFGIFGRHVGATWQGFGGPLARRYNVHTSEATLHDVGKDEVVWTGTLQTVEPENIGAAIKSYIQTIIQALQEKNLLGLKK
jgi:hypothetical protein